MQRLSNHEFILNTKVDWLAQFKARRFCRRQGFSSSDIPDVEQELRLHLLEQASKFDPAVTSLESFVSYILDMKCASLWRYRAAAMRSPEREECSLNDPVLDADFRIVDRHETTPEAANVRQRLLDLEHDVAEVLNQLPPETWAVARELVDGTANSVAVELGISRRRAAHLIDELRKRFEEAGLCEYL